MTHTLTGGDDMTAATAGCTPTASGSGLLYRSDSVPSVLSCDCATLVRLAGRVPLITLSCDCARQGRLARRVLLAVCVLLAVQVSSPEEVEAESEWRGGGSMIA